MKRFEEMSFYDLLDIPFEASSFEIKQAYRETMSIYNENSLSTYAFFSVPERVKVLEKIEQAFQTLIDDKKRLEYEKQLVAAGKMPASALKAERIKKAVPIFETDRDQGKDYLHRWIKTRFEEEELKNKTEEIITKELISGRDLKKVRESTGMRLEELYELTRIGVTKLKAIEEDAFGELPPEVYLRNFLKRYAEIFHLDQDKIAKGYLKNMAAAAPLPVEKTA